MHVSYKQESMQVVEQMRQEVISHGFVHKFLFMQWRCLVGATTLVT